MAGPYLDSRGIGRRAATAARLGVVTDPLPGHEQQQGRLVIPYITRAGVVNLKFRCMEDHECKTAGHPKYSGLTNKKPRLYNVNAFFDRGSTIAVTEGELDALVLSHYADIPAVGCPGVAVWQPHHPRCFTSYELVLMFADGDQPGRDFARHVAKELSQVRVVYLPDGMDVNTVFLAEGAEGLRQRAGI